jgi:hypothetical protein
MLQQGFSIVSFETFTARSYSMPILLQDQEIVSLISEFMRSEVTETADEFAFAPRLTGGRPVRLTHQQLGELRTSLGDKDEREETALYSRESYERLVKDESRFGLPSIRRAGMITREDTENVITYTLGAPSDEYLIFLFSKVRALGSVRLLRSPLVSASRVQELMGREGVSIFDIVRAMMPRLLTVRITSTRNRGFQDLSRHANAFLFQLTYNLDAPIVETRYIDDLLRSGRIVRNRRSQIEEIEPPRRFYIPDLVYQYQMGVATDSALLEYLSYFHVAEHFFEEVFNDDLVRSVRDMITQPGFSYRRKRDIQELVKHVNKKLKNRGETVIFSELEALRLTLERFLDVPDLQEKVREYDPALLAYYATTIVPFSEGDRVDLAGQDASAVLSSLARRIYKTRNAIVHSKESEKSRYIPYQHDQMLLKEVPLLRFVAEAIIIRTSELFT